MYKYSFEKLEIWIVSKELTKRIYSASEGFPKAELYGLRSQVTRASVSVASNIAEGSSRASKKDQAHFINIAYSSLMEVINLLYISADLHYIEEGKLTELKEIILKLSNKLNAFRKSLN